MGGITANYSWGSDIIRKFKTKDFKIYYEMDSNDKIVCYWFSSSAIDKDGCRRRHSVPKLSPKIDLLKCVYEKYFYVFMFLKSNGICLDVVYCIFKDRHMIKYINNNCSVVGVWCGGN